jgi:uncharacterized phage protein (TIGR02216 family)
MAVGLGVLRLSPAAFWSMTWQELEAAIRGRCGTRLLPGAPSRSELGALMQRFPDAC